MVAFGLCATTNRARLFRKRTSTQCFFYGFVRSTLFWITLFKCLGVFVVVPRRFVSDCPHSGFVALATSAFQPVKISRRFTKRFRAFCLLAQLASFNPILG
jgi:hypothetical protein